MERKERILVSFGIGFALCFLLWDIISDLKEGSSWAHCAAEIIALAIGLMGLLYLLTTFFRLQSENKAIHQEVMSARKDLENFRKETSHLVKGINEKIQIQMNAWKFSPAEKDVCLLLLKGMSTKDIAYARSTAEKTISLHLTSIYQKSRLQGRSELFAFFLEDIFASE